MIEEGNGTVGGRDGRAGAGPEVPVARQLGCGAVETRQMLEPGGWAHDGCIKHQTTFFTRCCSFCLRDSMIGFAAGAGALRLEGRWL